MGCRLDERIAAADEDVLGRLGQPADKLGHHGGIDAAAEVLLTPRLVAGERERELKPSFLASSASSSSRKMTSSQVREENSKSAGTRDPTAARWRSIDISGTTPEPPPSRSSGPPSSTSQTKCPPIGPRNSMASPTSATSWKKGETSPSSSRSMASSIAAVCSGAEAIE